jgi:hypothetical protein
VSPVITTTEVSGFLKWRAKMENVKKARDAKTKKNPKKTDPNAHVNWFRDRKKRLASQGDF